ncbi:hypothetical protein RO3G_12293 [Rhizopus delemar RA 99-880]|uniref:Uncharacterized protein n=1 Tax=Rhizopus delemar (strain RA 99-880 / ATCC MYA-4621 / FGSC 9543 / NRRL 43880) TaxID=246409 RepID=I1CGK2_RHIO9|nr:hypothetical protein RO3G_12293 [Rhizopus delemar RA 99-880]|eukprot:EIE87582.1 hypothetical protein RO3G_12293 [Rhizopus delemar RA 99-880]
MLHGGMLFSLKFALLSYVLYFESSVDFLTDSSIRSVIEKFQIEQWMLDHATVYGEYNQGFTIDKKSFNLKIKHLFDPSGKTFVIIHYNKKIISFVYNFMLKNGKNYVSILNGIFINQI